MIMRYGRRSLSWVKASSGLDLRGGSKYRSILFLVDHLSSLSKNTKK